MRVPSAIQEGGDHDRVGQIADVHHVQHPRPVAFLTDEHIPRVRPVPGVVGENSPRGRRSADLDRICGRTTGNTIADVEDHQPGTRSADERETVSHVHVMSTARVSVHDLRISGVADVDNGKQLPGCVHVVTLDPGVVNAVGEACNDLGAQGVREVKQGDAAVIVRNHAERAVSPNLHVADRTYSIHHKGPCLYRRGRVTHVPHPQGGRGGSRSHAGHAGIGDRAVYPEVRGQRMRRNSASN